MSINVQCSAGDVLSHLNSVLEGRDYLVGTLFSLGDIAVFSALKGAPCQCVIIISNFI